MTKPVRGRSSHNFHAPSLAPSYADIVRTSGPMTNVIQASPSAELSEKFENKSSERERRTKLLQVQVTHPAILTVLQSRGTS